jgi:type IV pilus assembly protein PilM
MAAKYLTGIDIGYSSIKAVSISHKDNPPKLLSFGQIAAPQPGIVSDADLDLEAVANAIKALLNEVKPPSKDIVIALPESNIFTRVVYDLPFLTDDELAQAIRYAAEEFVPMPINDVNLNYQILFRSPQKGPKSRTVVFVVASPKSLVEKYLKVATLADIKPQAIETEMIATARALVSYNQFSPTTLIIQLGAIATDFAVVSEGLILLTRSISTGGIALTRSIAQALNFELIQAEEYKKVYGLLQDQLEGKLFQILKPIMDVILSEAKRVILSHETQNPQRPIKRVVLTGGGASMPGLVIYFANALGLEVQEADPWVAVNKEGDMKKKLTTPMPFYSVAVGLALKNI